MSFRKSSKLTKSYQQNQSAFGLVKDAVLTSNTEDSYSLLLDFLTENNSSRFYTKIKEVIFVWVASNPFRTQLMPL